ncbi:MAG: CBS domain-containing protein [Gammaproteobacteria bacterium]
MKKVKDIMTRGVECVGEHDTLTAAARRMRELDIGSLPICGDDNRLRGMLTDRDIVIKVLADGGDPSHTEAGKLAQGKPFMVHESDTVDEALKVMTEHKVRRVPVLDDKQKLVGIVSQGDIAVNLAEKDTGRLVESISASA